jgi:cysteine desulfurase family protein
MPVEGLAYLDNAATTWPKPPGVAEAMTRYLAEVGASPGRAGHRLAQQAGREVLETRERLGDLLGAPDPEAIVLTKNATEALNIALLGTLREGDRVIVGGLEHNSVMRPLRHLQATRGVVVDVVRADPTGSVDPSLLRAAARTPARLVVIAHASNVTGAIAPLMAAAEAAEAARARLLVDAAQSAGSLSIDMTGMRIDLLAVTGHKGLFGPQGTGALLVRGEWPEPLMFGGTGSNSEAEVQPDFLPDRLESGTLNGVGFAGLAAGLAYVAEQGVDAIHRCSAVRLGRLIEGLAAIPGVTLHGPADPVRQIAVLSFTMRDLTPAEIGMALDEQWGILTRVGLHCAPAAHRTLGTFPGGTVRLSLSHLNTDEHVERTIAAVRELAGR